MDSISPVASRWDCCGPGLRGRFDVIRAEQTSLTPPHNDQVSIVLISIPKAISTLCYSQIGRIDVA